MTDCPCIYPPGPRCACSWGKTTVDDLVPCKVCDGSKRVIEWMMSEFPVPVECPCTRRRPCDPLCRCSGGPL